MEEILLTDFEHETLLQQQIASTLDTAATATTISVVDTTGVVLIVVPFIVLIGLFLVVVVLCKRRLHRGIKIAKVGKTNHIQMMIQNQKIIHKQQSSTKISKKDAPRKTFGSKKEYEMTQSFSKYVWGVQEKVINTLSAVEMKHHQVEGFDSIFTQSRYALSSVSLNSPSSSSIPSFRTPNQQPTTSNLKNSWYWKAEESAIQESPKPKQLPNSNQPILTPKRRTDAMESQSFIDDDGLDEYTTIHNIRDNEALLQERKSLLETQPISYKQFIQHSIIIIEQAAGLCCDLPCNQLGITTRQIIEYIRDRVGFSQDDCERYLKFLEKASYSSEKTCITDREFELFSASFLSILQQIDSYYLQTTLL